MEVFFFAKGARSCSIVGAAFCLGINLFETYLLGEALKLGVAWRRIAFAHEEHVQAAFLLARLKKDRGKTFMLFVQEKRDEDARLQAGVELLVVRRRFTVAYPRFIR